MLDERLRTCSDRSPTLLLIMSAVESVHTRFNDDDEEDKLEDVEFLGKAPKNKDGRVTFYGK